MTTITINTADLIGNALDFAVAKALGHAGPARRYSTDWALTGPLLIEHGIGFFRNGKRVYANEGKRWEANRTVNLDEAPILRHGYRAHGPDPLVASLRCLVLSRLGETVDVPTNLVEA